MFALVCHLDQLASDIQPATAVATSVSSVTSGALASGHTRGGQVVERMFASIGMAQRQALPRAGRQLQHFLFYSDHPPARWFETHQLFVICLTKLVADVSGHL